MKVFVPVRHPSFLRFFVFSKKSAALDANLCNFWSFQTTNDHNRPLAKTECRNFALGNREDRLLLSKERALCIRLALSLQQKSRGQDARRVVRNTPKVILITPKVIHIINPLNFRKNYGIGT